MADRTAPDVLRDAADALALAERALAEIINQPGRGRVAGIRNLPVWGRIVTQTIENLRTVVSRDVFNRWWAPWQAQLRDDPDFRYLWDLRNQIEKEGNIGRLGFVMNIDYLDSSQLGPAPAKAEGMFIGDQWGGAGWVVRRPDGTAEKFYAQLPDTAKSKPFFTEPTTSQKRTPPVASVDVIAVRYVDILRGLY